MNYLNGGYVMLDKADSNIYTKALGALNAGKPILWYENSTTCYYIDTLAKSGDDIVLTKGGKTITITSSNVVTENGDIQNHLYQHNIELMLNNTYGDEIGYLKDSGTSIQLSSGDFCKIYLSYIDNSNEEVNEYDKFTQYDSLNCNIDIKLGSITYHGVCQLIPNESIGDKSYYTLKGLIISTQSPYDFGYADIDFDSVGTDFTITDTITQLF